MTALVMLYLRTPIARLVGDSDIAHAVPLTLIADVLRSNRDPAGWQRVRASLVRHADLVADNGRCRFTAVPYGGRSQTMRWTVGIQPPRLRGRPSPAGLGSQVRQLLGGPAPHFAIGGRDR